MEKFSEEKTRALLEEMSDSLKMFALTHKLENLEVAQLAIIMSSAIIEGSMNGQLTMEQLWSIANPINTNNTENPFGVFGVKQ